MDWLKSTLTFLAVMVVWDVIRMFIQAKVTKYMLRDNFKDIRKDLDDLEEDIEDNNRELNGKNDESVKTNG